MRPSLLAAAFLSVALAVGCTPQDKLYDVTGTVTFGGQSVPKGLIYFEPDGSKGMKGSLGYANIENGAYDTKVNGGKGVKGGWYSVRVLGYDGKPTGEQILGNGLFPEYTEKKEFPAAPSVYDVTVPDKKK